MLRIVTTNFLMVTSALFGSWNEQESEVLTQAALHNKPIVAAFVGKEFCPWSQKMTLDLLDQDIFQQKMGDEAVLWKVPLDQQNTEDQLALRKKYHVDECPMILLLDPMGREFARVGYLPLEADDYSSRLIHIIEDFQEICVALDEVGDKQSVQRWKELYIKAGQLSIPAFKEDIIERGIKVDKGSYFLIEKYALLLQTHKLKHKDVKACRQQLAACDPENRWGTQFKVAMLEFQKRSASPKKPCDKVVRPLLLYLGRYGKKDKENAWKAELTIAQYLFTRKAIPLALQYAKEAQEKAPESMKNHIAQAIDYMKSQDLDEL